MKNDLKTELIRRATHIISDSDPSHDISHALRVLANSEHITKYEGGDLEVIIPAALFHDAVNYRKDDPRSKYAAEESAIVAERVLTDIAGYDPAKTALVKQAIIEHSYNKGIRPTLLESKIVQDADRLEATGAIAIMRTFSSSGQMGRRFYHPEDPLCENREPVSVLYALDLFHDRLLKVENLMNTETAKRMARNRTEFLYTFMEQLRTELGEPTRFS